MIKIIDIDIMRFSEFAKFTKDIDCTISIERELSIFSVMIPSDRVWLLYGSKKVSLINSDGDTFILNISDIGNVNIE